MASPYASAVPSTGDGLRQLIRAEWTKLRSVRRWAVALLVTIGLTALISVGLNSSNSTNANEGPFYIDQFSFVHQSLNGDGSVTARIVSQDPSHEWAKAGVIVKASTASGAPFAALVTTPGHGVRLLSNFDIDIDAGGAVAPVWLRLTRSGDTVSAARSSDGLTWNEVGTVAIAGLPRTVQVGLLVTSPPDQVIERQFGAVTIRGVPTAGAATFDNVAIESPGAPAEGDWEFLAVRAVTRQDGPADPDVPPSGVTESAGSFTVTGYGDVTAAEPGDNDVVQDSLVGALVVLLVVVPITVLFITSEYRRGMIRTTLAATPRRGRVFVAKAAVAGLVAFAAGLVAAAVAYLVARPILADGGYSAPAYPELPISEPVVLRAVVGTAIAVAAFGLLGLGLGTVLRRTAAPVTIVLALVLLPPIVSEALPLDVAKWLERLTPAAGFAVQQTRERFDVAIGPWAGLAVACAYAAVALLAGYWSLRRRDA